MVSYVPAGRLGNAMFQCSMIMQYAWKHGLEFHVPSTTNDKYWNPIYFPHLRNPNFNPHRPTVYIKEKTHAYHEIPFEESWRNKNIIFSGYWQSQKYFDWCREDLLKAFAIPWNPHSDISIHVRRGDYLQYPDKHPVIPREYYVEALKIFSLLGYREAYVFSDDIKWCKEFFPTLNSGFAFYYSEGKTEMEDLIGMSNCAGGHINSSSTFSWMGSWLDQNPKKIIVTPKQWFVEGHGGLDTKDLIPDNWIKI
jgi:hypothetical protein